MPFDDLPPLLRSASQGADGAAALWMRREVRAGRLLRLHAGVFVRADEWAALSSRRRHLLRIVAVVPRDSRLVLSHESAAAIHGLPILSRWPDTVHVADPARTGGRRGGWQLAGATTHSASLCARDVIEFDGFRVTAPVRTAGDFALRPGLRDAVSFIDGALAARLATKDAIRGDLEGRPGRRGRRLALQAVDFADARAQLPGESLTRVVLSELGVPPPVPQWRFVLPNGQIAFADFYWPEFGVILEFDGDVKYSDPAYRGTLSVSEVIVRERKREKLLLRLSEVREVVRTDWAEVRAVRPLATALREAGVPVPFT